MDHKKKCVTHYFLLLFLTLGCTRFDVDPTSQFCEVKEEIVTLTNQTIYWDPTICGNFQELSLCELIQEKLTDEKAVKIALLNNRALQALYEDLGIAKADLVQAGLLRNPIFSFSYEFTTKRSITDLINMGLMQNFLEILLIPLKKQSASEELERTKALLVTRILDVIAETKMAYYTALYAETIGKLKQEALLAAELSYEAAERLFQAGNLKELEVTMQRSLYEQMKLEVASWEIAILEARERLNVLMGLWGGEINWTLSPSLPSLPVSEENYDDIENQAIAMSVDLRASYHNLLATAARFGVDTSKLRFPQFDLGVASEREEGIWYVGPAINLAIPLFDFGQANSAKAHATLMKEWNQYTALAIEIRSKARAARFSFLNHFRQSRFLEKIVIPLAEELTHLVLLQHNAMQMGVFQLLETKKREIEKKMELLEMQREYWISKIKLQTLLNGHVVGQEHVF